MGWNRALRAAAAAVALVLVVAFAAANFVPADVRLWSLDVHTRLAWAVIVPAALSFAAGRLSARSRRPPPPEPRGLNATPPRRRPRGPRPARRREHHNVGS
jgi:hypothetical protein